MAAPNGLQLALLSIAAGVTAVGALLLGAVVGAGVWGIDGLREHTRLLLDDQPPRLLVLTPDADHKTPQRVVTVRGRVDDAGPVTLTVGGKEAALREVDGRLEFAHVVSLQEGANAVEVVATDRGGRTTTVRRAVERTAWTLTELEPQAGLVLREPWVVVRGRVDPPQRGEVRLGGLVRPIGPDGRFRFTARNLAEGGNALSLEVRPERCASRTETRAVTVDSIAPVITITAPTAALRTFRREVELSGSVADAGLTELTVGERSLPAAPGPFKLRLPLPTLGKHTLRVTARDRAGHETTVTRVVERIRPRIDLVIDQPREGARLRKTSIRVSGRVSGQVPLEELRLSIGGVPAVIGADGRFSGRINRGEGTQRLEVVARGAGGEARAVRTITCDVTAPRVAIHTPHDYMTTSRSVLFVRGTVSDAAPYVDVRVGFKSVRVRNPALGRPFTLTFPLKVGRNRLVVTAVDSAGNRSAPTFLNVIRRTRFTPPPPVAGKVRLDGIRVGQGLRYGDWHVWRTTNNLLLWVHPTAAHAVEMATDSNGWFRYATSDGKTWVVLGLKAPPRPQPLGSPNWRSYLGRRATLQLDTASATLQRYRLTASGGAVRLENTQLQTTLEFTAKRSVYRYTHPSGQNRSFGPKGPVATSVTTGGVVALARLPVGSGARWGDWIVWRPRTSKLLMVHTAERHAVELILDSNGWFRMAPRAGRPIVIYTFGKNTPGTIGIAGWKSYLARSPRYSLKSQTGSLYRYTFELTPAAFVLKNTHFSDTLRFGARSPKFTFSKPNRPTARAFGPTGELARVAPPKPPQPPKPPAGNRVSFQNLPVGQGGQLGGWTVWKLSRGRILLTHAGERAAIEVVAASNGWFRYATKDGKQFIVHGHASKPVPQQLTTRRYAGYFIRRAAFTLTPGVTILQNWTAEVSTTGLKLRNRRYKDTLVVTPKSARYRYTKPGGRERWFGPKGELKEQ